MNATTDITEGFGTLYHPKSALVFYETTGSDTDTYVEYFDMDRNGNPMNAHPLTVREAQALAKSLDTRQEAHKAFLKPNGILPVNVLQISPSEHGSVLWYTKAQERPLYFVKNLGIPDGKASVPPMVWYANKSSLAVFALSTNRRPDEKTPLYHAPFFNVYENGNVCMGTVDIHIKQSSSLEGFMAAWENYFFNSYFSHLMSNHNPVKGNCVHLWKRLLHTGTHFPKDVLKKNNKTLKSLLR